MGVFETFVITALAVLPGALFTFAYERETNIVQAALSDRLLRLAAGSAVFYLAAAPGGYWIYLHYVRTGRLASGPIPWVLWLALLALIACPVALGVALGAATRHDRRWARLYAGRSPRPRAWDAVFGSGQSAWLRIRLKDSSAGTDGWLLGVFAPSVHGPPSYASSYPEIPDLYLSDTAEAEPGTGNYILDQDGQPKLRGVGLLIDWDEISYLEISYGPGPQAGVR